MKTDSELLQDYLDERSEAAFAQLVERHLNLVYFAALRQLGGDVHGARDVAQGVFTDLARKASRLRDRTSLSGWLHTSTRFAAAKVRRAAARRRQWEGEAEFMQTQQTAAETHAVWEQLHPIVDDAVEALRARDREAVLLRFFEDRSFTEIGQVLHVSEDAARMRVDRALEKLRSILARRGVSSSCAALMAVFSAQAGAAVPRGLSDSIATSAAAGAAGSKAGLLLLPSFMSINKSALALLVALLLAISAAINQQYQFRLADSRRAAAESDVTAANTRLIELRAGAEAAVQARLGLEETRAELQASQTAAATARRTIQAEANLAQRTEPALLQVRTERLRKDIEVDYWPFFHELQFNRAQIDRFIDILSGPYLAALSEPNGLSRLPIEMGVARDAPMREALLAAVQSEFGAVVLDRYERFISTSSPRNLVNHVTMELYFTDDPLTADQAERLVTLVTEAANYAPGSPAMGTLTGNVGRVVDWNRLQADAQSFLRPAQLEGWRAAADSARVNMMLADANKAAAAAAKQ